MLVSKLHLFAKNGCSFFGRNLAFLPFLSHTKVW